MFIYKSTLLFLIIIIVIIIISIIIYCVVKHIKKPVVYEYFNNITYIFWTGGFDSTFRILQALIDENKIVQPIYLSGIIDNLKENHTRRHNVDHELTAIKNITELFNKKYPNKKNNLKQLIVVNNVKIRNDVYKAMKVLHKRRLVRRPVCQYASLAQYSIDFNKPIELVVENEHGSIMRRAVIDKLIGSDTVRKIDPNVYIHEPEFQIYDNFRFPTIYLSKKNMYDIAKKNGYNVFLEKTWSCWYPVNGKPCGRCVMCRERII